MKRSLFVGILSIYLLGLSTAYCQNYDQYGGMTPDNFEYKGGAYESNQPTPQTTNLGNVTTPTITDQDKQNLKDNTDKSSQNQQSQGSAASEVGINFNGDCLMGMGKGCFDYEKVIGIDEAQNPNITATSIAQDVILSATYMVGTVLTIVIIWCGLGYIFASRDGKDVSKYKKGLISAAIGALLVRGAYAIVRLIQYIAQG